MATTERPSSLYRLAVAISRPIVQGIYRLEVVGSEHVPREGGFVVAANHTSNLDPWPLGCALSGRQLHYMAKSELWKPGLRTILKALGSFPVERGAGDAEALATAVRIVTNGGVMAMFPEGTRRNKGLRKRHQPRPHTGTVRIAMAANALLVPAAINGMDRLSRLGPLLISFGAPIALEDLQGLDSFEAAREGTTRLWAEMQRLEAELTAP